MVIEKENESSLESVTKTSSLEEVTLALTTMEELDEEGEIESEEFISNLSKVNLGKILGKPRKTPKMNHFFDYACRSKKTKEKGSKIREKK